MRIAMVCPYSLSRPGGVQGQVIGLSHALRRLGHEVQIVAPGEAGWSGEAYRRVGRPFSFAVNGSVAAMAPQPSAAARTARAVRAEVDVVHLHEPLAPSITLAALASARAPLVGTFHAGGDRTPYALVAPLLRRAAGRLTERVAVSEEAERLARRHLGGRYQTLFNGVDAEAFQGVPRRERPGSILFLGRHEARKGLDVLLDALHSLPAGVTLRVAGDGPEHERLRRRAGSDRRVSWLGQLSEQAKIIELRTASVLCAPSRHGESFGVVLLEAMAAGTPVVASDLVGYRAAAGPLAARLVPPGEARPLAEALRGVLGDPVVRASLRAAGQARVEEFSMAALAERYVAVYHRALRHRSGSLIVV